MEQDRRWQGILFWFIAIVTNFTKATACEYNNSSCYNNYQKEDIMADAIALLQELGFSEYEARAYQALLQHNPVTG